MHFFAQIFCQFKKKQYFCSRFRNELDLYNLVADRDNASIAQLVEH